MGLSTSSLVASRGDCRVCKGPLSLLFDLGYQEVINLGDREPLKAPLTVMRCQSCNLVQLDSTVSKDYLFRSGYNYRSGATQTMRSHLKGIVEDVMKRAPWKRQQIVVDIGSNDNTLLGFYPNEAIKIGFDPAGLQPDPMIPHITVEKDFFSADRFEQVMADFWPDEERQASVITCLSVFYDLDDPDAFLADVKKVLAPDGLFVLQVNDLAQTLRNNAVGDFVHEHLTYWTLETLQRVLRDNDFGVEDYKLGPINGGSVVVYARHLTRKNDVPWAPGEDELDFSGFYDRVMNAAIRTRAYTLGKVVDVLGASTRGATFIQLANIQGRFCVERDDSKIGKTYLGMPIVSESLSFANPPECKVAMIGWFKDEMLAREKAFLDGGGTVILPLPEPRLITKDGERPLP